MTGTGCPYRAFPPKTTSHPYPLIFPRAGTFGWAKRIALFPSCRSSPPSSTIACWRNTHTRTNKRILGKSIDERPEEINNRSVFGHWEIDCVLLKKTKEKVLLTMIERVSRHSIIRLIESKTAACVSQAIRALQKEYGTSFDTIFQSITSDNGSEFADLTSSSTSCSLVSLCFGYV